MAGTLFGLGLSPQFDASGLIARGALLYIYAANTSTPSTTYSDFSLTSSQVWPLVADGGGRLPAFWLNDGSYRARLTTSAGIDIFDEQSVTTIGASSGSSSGGTSQDTTTLFQTGFPLWMPISGTMSGFVRANGLTLGNGSSGGTERANSDTQDLFEFLWNNFLDATCAVSTGRGASATADYNANKTITLLDMRGRSAFGADDMGNSAASRLTAGTPTTVASTGGAEKQTIATGNLPSHTHGAGSYALTSTALNKNAIVRGSSTINSVQNSGGANNNVPVNATANETVAVNDGTITGTSGAAGSGTALATTPPYMLGTWYLKL